MKIDRKDELAEQIVAYALEHGLSDASLRPLASAVGTNARMLIYHFGSKDAMIVDILDRARRGQEELLRAALAEQPTLPLPEKLTRLWHALSSKRNEAFARLFFEAYGLGIQGRTEYGVALKASVAFLSDLMEQLFAEGGRSRADSRLLGSMAAAAFRGLLVDLLATGDRSRINSTAYHVIQQVADAPVKKGK
jgi:AcrR family transcriptional regulator